MKTIPLTQGKVAFVDDEDFERLNRFKWFAWRYGHIFYAARQVRTPTGKQKAIRMHREILSAPPKTLIDHKNGNGLDNRKENLRLASHQQNCQNRRLSASKGVYHHKPGKRWYARIQVDGVSKHLGSFDHKVEAAHAYDAAAIKFFGEFARPNFKPQPK